ncbi:helix-turn-helix domain-containing protein [Microbacterium aurantiacum]|uniref:helix-turn-helix domain-containing protein n=1 Tax=Microbacterium aurantiacum TaxID=162393 RepID=UPI00344AC3F0
MSDSTITDDAAAARRLGAHVRRLRHARGLTLVQLAERIDLSHPFLSQLERGLAQPSLGSLRRLAVALETSPIEIIAAADEDADTTPAVQVVGPDSGAVPEGFASGAARMLAHRPGTFRPMEISGDAIEPGEHFVHAEDEFVYVLAGRVRIELDGRVHDLEPGASVSSPGGTSHRWWSADGAPFRLLVVKQAW